MSGKDNKGSVGGDSGKIKRNQLFQRHPSSYEQEPDDDTDPKKSRLKTSYASTSLSADESSLVTSADIPVIVKKQSPEGSLQSSSSKEYQYESSVTSRTALAKNAFLQGTPVLNLSSASIDDSDNEPIATIRVPLIKSNYVETPSSTDEQSSSCSKTSFHELQESDGEFSENANDIPQTTIDPVQSPSSKKLIPEITIHKKTTRHAHAPTLSRFRRIESDSDPLDRDKLAPQMEYSSCEYLLNDFEKHEPSDILSLVKSNRTSPELETNSKSIKAHAESESREESPKSSSKPSPEHSDKEAHRFWLTRTMSKMLDDKSRPSATISQEKKRSKSPSSLIEFAQKKLPKWASFIKKSDDECDSSSKASTPDSSKLKRNVVGEKSKSAEEYDRRNKFIPAKPHSSEEYYRDTRHKGILRRKAVEDSVDVVDGDKFLTPSILKGSKKSPEGNESRSSKFYAFPFLGRSKDRKDCKDSKPKSADHDNTSSIVHHKECERMDVATHKRSHSDFHQKKANKSESKQSSFEEKTKFFFKQKSKEKSNESSRKNSLNIGSLKAKYNKWTRSTRDDQVKAASAETLNGLGKAVEGLVQGEFLAASMRLFLVASPPFARLPIRSRSLSNLDALDTKKMRLLDNYFLARMLFGIQTSTPPAWYSSMPDLSAENFSRGICYQPGPTTGRSVFVRRTRSKLRHTNSMCSFKDFFQLTFPSSCEESFDLGSLEPKKFLHNSVFLPAIGNVSLRRAVQNIFDKKRFFGLFTLTECTARINGSAKLYSMDNVDTGQLGGAHVTLHDASILKMFRKTSVEPLPKSSESGRMSSPASTHKDSKTPLSHKLKWSNFFRSKENTVNMEKLSMILNKFSEDLPPIPLDRKTYNSMKSFMVSKTIIEMPFEDLIDTSSLSREEEMLQRAIYELLSTEVEYIGSIYMIVELFLSVALFIQSQNLMLEVDTERLFLNITDILKSNLLFWESSFHPMMTSAAFFSESALNQFLDGHSSLTLDRCPDLTALIIKRSFRFNTAFLANGFLKFEEFFHPYQYYVLNQAKSHAYCKEMVEESSLYAAYLTWCEAHKRCKRLRLSDMLVKPMQRLTKYGLLISSIYKLVNGDPEKTLIRKMYSKCRKFTFDLNCQIHYIDDVDGMNKINEMIDSYDAMETKDEEIDVYLRLHSNLRLKDSIAINGTEYHRSIILEGDVKYKDCRDKYLQLEAKAVLFTDYLLILLPSKKKKSLYRVVRPKIMISQIFCYPQFAFKEGSRDLASLIVVQVDPTCTACGYFVLNDANNKDLLQPSLKTWLFALKEAQLTMNMLPELNYDPREEYYDIEAQSNAAFDARLLQILKATSLDDDGIILEPIEALMPSIILATKKRLCTLIQAVEASKVGLLPPSSDGRSQITHPNNLRSQSFASSLQYSYSGSYECNDWEIIGAAIRRPGSGDTSTGRRTISLSSDEGPNASLYFDIISETRHAIVKAHSPNTIKSYGRQMQTAATIEPVPHCSKNSPVATKFTRPSVTVNFNNNMSPPPKHPTKHNTLTVDSSINLRQSMPNLTVPMNNLAPGNAMSRNCLNVPTSIHRMPRSSGRHLGTPEKFLSPDTRGTSYPPPSSSRASLQRGFAFSSNHHPS